VEEFAEIVERFRAFGLLSDDDVNPEPVQRVFRIEVRAAA
jgi:hypothetical protein